MFLTSSHSLCWSTMSSYRWRPDIHRSKKNPQADFNEVNSELNVFSLPPALCPIPLTFPLSLLFLPLFLPLVQYQMEMMRSLRHVNIDHLHVGWYQSTYYGSFVSRALLDSQFSYQHAIEESVVLIYGK